VILNVPGWRQRNESQPTLSFAAAPGVLPEEAAGVDNTLRLLLVTRNEELEQELRGLRFLLWRAGPRAKIKLGSVVKLTLPLHHEELMRSPVEEFVAHWQEAVEPHGHGQETDDRIIESCWDLALPGSPKRKQIGRGAVRGAALHAVPGLAHQVVQQPALQCVQGSTPETGVLCAHCQWIRLFRMCADICIFLMLVAIAILTVELMPCGLHLFTPVHLVHGCSCPLLGCMLLYPFLIF
jgi:hypothetical protein